MTVLQAWTKLKELEDRVKRLEQIAEGHHGEITFLQQEFAKHITKESLK
ncbi:MAG TPA: hypothetical protein VJ343_02705 [archaeon]|nr:hypothetical protein [archaeon]